MSNGDVNTSKKPAAKKKTTAKKTSARRAQTRHPARSARSGGRTSTASAPANRPGQRSKPRRSSGTAGTRSAAPKPITQEQRRAMIAEAAYFKAEKRGFEGGDPNRDWCEAEAEVDALILRLGNTRE